MTKVIIRTPGPQGVPGLGTATAAYVHPQVVASPVWTIVHNLGYRPNATAIDASGDVVEGQIFYDSANQMTIAFSAAVAGTAYLS